MDITVKSFHGVGDLLFATPSFRVIKETYPDAVITVNTSRPELLTGNPFITHVGTEDKGLFLDYMDPFHCVSPTMLPTKHHILAHWEGITKHYCLKTPEPELRPELYCMSRKDRGAGVGVQVDHKGQWFSKKVWPYSLDLARHSSNGYGVRPIPYFPASTDLVKFIAGLRLVVCCEGGVQHIAAAVGTPAIVIYGGFARPEWNGYPFQRNVVNEKSCSYCYNPHPCVSEVERECMREITVEKVMGLIQEEFLDG